MRQGRTRTARNLLRGRTAERRVSVVDLWNAWGLGGTVVVFPDGATERVRAAVRGFEPPSGWKVEVGDDSLVAYRPAWTCRAAQLPVFIAEALRIQDGLNRG